MVSRITKVATASALAAVGVMATAGGLQMAQAQTASTLPTVTVTETGKAIAVAGTLESGAVNVVITTTGEQEGSPSLFAMKPGVTPAQVQAVLAQKSTANTPDALDALGSIVFDGSAPKGVTQLQTVLPPGNYIAVDTGSANSPAQAPSTTFTVSSNPRPAALPAADATISTIEFGFRGPKTLKRGSLVRVQNSGYLMHMVLALPVANAKAARKLTATLIAGNDRKAQKLVTGQPLGLTGGPLSTGGMQQGVLTAKPGYYVLVCFMDAQDGREHTRLGMERTIRIVG